MPTAVEQVTPRKVRELWDKGLRATRTERPSRGSSQASSIVRRSP